MACANFVSVYGRVKLLSLWTIQFITGLLLGILVTLFTVLSSPVYLFRWIMIRLAKYLRPDLSRPLNPTSSGLVLDMYSSTKTPRGNTVFSLMFNGDLDHAQFVELVLEKWIHAKDKSDMEGELKYPQFTQFSVSWWGLMFWKWDDNFDIQSHIHFHSNPEGLKDSELDQAKEELLNAPHPPNKSPWEIHILSNYRNPELHPGEISVVLLKFHHSFTDGYGMLHAVAEDLLGGSLGPAIPKVAVPPKMSFWGHAAASLMTPVNVCVALGGMAWDVLFVNIGFVCLLASKPLRVHDRKKAWHQFYAKSKLIPVHQLKHIKNNFGVSFTSVILSGISSGLHKALEDKRKNDKMQMKDGGSTYFLNVIPLPPETREERLTNHLTAALFHLPTGSFNRPLDRMFECSGVLDEAQNSIIPKICSTLTNVGGYHFRWALKFFMRFLVTIPTGLSNFPSVGEGFVGNANGKRLIFLEAVTGCQVGVAGILFVMTSSFGQSRMAVTAEEAVFSRDELHELVKVVEEEIDRLYELSVVDKERRR